MVLFQFTGTSYGPFSDAIRFLEQLGIVDVILPFILIFTLLFAVLQKVKLFGPDSGSKKYNIVFAIIIASITVIPHVTGTYPPNADVINIINNSLPQIALVIVAILMVLLMTGIIGGGEPKFDFGKWIGAIAFVIVAYIFGASAGWWNLYGFFNYFSDPNLLTVVILLLVFGGVIWFVTHEKEPTTPTQQTAAPPARPPRTE